MPLETSSVGEGRAPEITVPMSKRFHELYSIYFVDYIALPARPPVSADYVAALWFLTYLVLISNMPRPKITRYQVYGIVL